MITTRTRILSILATVAMLVSMLACFVIPVTAAEASDYQEVFADIASGATNLSAYFNGDGSVIAGTTVDQLKTAAQADASSITWKTFVWDTEPFPRYALREAYEAAGYTQKVWSISAPADWLKMVADSKPSTDGSTLFSGTEVGLFTGVTFHLTETVDFKGQTMPALCYGSAGKDNELLGAFNGTIDGHGYGFKDIEVEVAGSGTANTISVGMICKLGYNAQIKDFGVDSGTITGAGPAKNLYISTFGEVLNNANSTAKLTRVWSGANIVVGGGTKTAAIVAGLSGYGRCTNSPFVLNGGYFFGTLDSTANSKVGIYFDTRAESIYNSLSDSANATHMIDVHDRGTVANNRSVGVPVTGGANSGTVTTTGGNNAQVTSALIGAYEINELQVENAVSGVDKVYYTITANGIRPTGTEANRIVTLKVNDGAEEYINNGTALTKADLAAKTGMDEASISTVLVNGVDKSGDATFIVDGNTTILAAESQIDWSGMLATAVAKYDGLDAKYFTAESAAKLTAFREAAATAGSDQAAIEAALELEEGLEDALETYATYPEAGGKEIPEYSVYNAYKDYNKNNHWAIEAPADWLAMVESSKVGDGNEANTFEGYTFHLLNDIDFADVEDPMDPLNYGTGAANDTSCPFNGTIEGNGFAFKNIKISVTGTSSSTNYIVGLIGKVGINATINNFGVDSGSITGGGTAKQMYVGTFGEPQTNGTDQPKLNRIWSGATITANATTATENANIAAGIFAAGQDSKVVINGAYFYGTVNALNAYGIYDYVKNAPKIYNALSDATYENATVESGMFRRRTTASDTFTLVNSFSVNAPVHPQADLIQTDVDGGKITNAATVTSVLEGAYEINKANLTAAAADGVDKVYYTVTANGIRPYGTEANRIVKYTNDIAEGDDVVQYDNAGTAVDIRAMFGIAENDAVTVTVGGSEVPADANGKYNITGDATITVVVDNTAELIAAAIATLDTELNKYTALLDAHLKTTAEIATDGKIGLPEFRAQVQAAKDANDLALLEAAVAVIENNNLVVEVSEELSKLPGYKDHAAYEAYNPAKSWAVRTTADWLAMVAASNAETDPETFEDCTIHVLADIDFADETTPMKPLNYCNGLSTDETAPFRGTIEGHDHVFKNINIEEAVSSETNPDTSEPTQEFVIGLIGKLGNGAVINNFGVESGTIKATGTSKLIYLSTFGKVIGGRTVTLNKVWSGVTLVSESESPSVAAGIIAPGANSNLTVNGAYFCGTLNAKRVLGLFHQLYTETFYNVLAAPTVVGSPTADAMFMKHSNATDGYTVINAFSVGRNIYSGFDGTDTNITNADVVGSALEGAWRINSANVAGEAATGVGKVYFTKVGDAIRFGEESNRIVKFTGTLNDEEEIRYANVGNNVDVLDLFGLKTAPNVQMTVTVDGNAVTPNGDGTYNINGDATVVATYDETDAWIAQLQAKIAEYDGLDTGYFKTADELAADEIGLADFISQANTAISERNATNLRTLVTYLKNRKLVAEITTNYQNVPAFKHQSTYYKYNKDMNWLIEDPADWAEMDRIAKLDVPTDVTTGEFGQYLMVSERTDSETGEYIRRELYFIGATFHLKHDVDFEKAEMLPLGARDIRAFRGTIDGHGYGFSNINIFVDQDDMTDTYYTYDTEGTMNGSIGLIGFLGRGAHIKDFGINSGSITAATGGNAGSVSSFGCVFENNTANPVTFTRVWSGADLLCKDKARKNVYLNALVGSFNGRAGTVNVNGFVFSGTMGKQQGGSDMAFGIYGGNRNGPAKNGTFANIVSFPIVSVGIQTYLFGFGSDDNYTNTAANISNVYGVKKNDTSKKVGMVYDYRNTDVQFGYDADGNATNVGGVVTDPTYLAATSGKEAAWMSNVNQTAGDANAVYFTLKDGAIRPVASDEEEIVKVTLNNTIISYVNKGTVLTKDALLDKAHINPDWVDSVTINSADVTADFKANNNYQYTLTDDAVIVIESSCKHIDNENETYTPVEGEEMHELLCSVCQGRIGDAAPCDLIVDANEVDLDNGHSSHTITCSGCNRMDEEECNGVRYTNPDDCTQDDIWEFDCGIDGHTGEFFVTGGESQYEEHDFTGVEWQYVEGSTTKQVRKCNRCNTLLYRIFGTISVTDVITPDVGEPADITITLPSGLLSADLKFTTTGEGYTITNVAGATKDGTIYKVNGTTTVTVTVSASTASRGGTFKVEMTNAIAREDDTTFVDANATTTIEFAGILGDANNDYEITLKDALDTLYVVVQKKPASTINLKNANVDNPTENPVATDITIADVRKIMVMWLELTMEEV